MAILFDIRALVCDAPLLTEICEVDPALMGGAFRGVGLRRKKRVTAERCTDGK